jgi:phage terminase large subunit-like protein
LKSAFLRSLSPGERQYLFTDWDFLAREEQRPPQGRDWTNWLFMGGRGSGETRAGAEWIANGVRDGKMNRIAIVGATHHEARSIMIEGVSGLLGVSEGAHYEPSLRRVTWPDGQVASVLSADEPDSIRGFQFDACWADELCKWPEPQETLDMIAMALRLGDNPRMMITTTPRKIPALTALLAQEDTATTHGTTRANAHHLAASFLRNVERRFKGTRLGRQELDGELIDDNENALWQREWIERHRLRMVPELVQIVVAIDPPASVSGAECGIVVAGKTKDGHGYVLADRSKGRLTSGKWASRALDAFEEFKAGSIVAEANNGGDMVRGILQQQSANVPVKMVHATRDKQTRAQPVAALYERGLIHHAGCFAELEDQMCQYDGTGKSPDRMDALVWALTDLFPLERRAEPNIRVL